MFVCREGYHPPLQHPYEGPFNVFESGSKTFKIDKRGMTETVTVDRLKLTHLGVDSPVKSTPQRTQQKKKDSVPTC